jgi:hypothetical protein
MRRRRRHRPLAPGRGTLALGAAATTIVGGVVLVELRRVWQRGSATVLREDDHPVLAAEEAVAETARVAREGYRVVSTRENSMFNLLASFASTFLVTRSVTYLLRRHGAIGPLRNLRVGRRHIHHYVPGIVIAFAAGTGAIVVRSERLDPILAIPFGVGMGLTLDESALLLELDDVYWSPEGLLSVQVTLTVIAVLGALALGLRFLRQGEQLVLVPDAASP